MRIVFVYGPESTNPYPEAVAQTLSADDELDVTLVTGARPRRADCRFAILPWLPARKSSPRILYLLSRLLTPCAIALIARFRGAVVILAFHGRVDAIVFGLANRLGLVTCVVAHNFGLPRSLSGSTNSERFLYSSSHLIIHTSCLLNTAPSARCKGIFQARHPLYDNILKTPVGPPSTEKPCALYLGNIRPDKGAADMVEIMNLWSQKEDLPPLLIAGRSAISSVPAVAEENPHIRWKVTTDGITDEELMIAVASSSLLIAPYRDVTASATILLALANGLGVIAYRNQSLAFLPEECLVEHTPSALVEAAMRYFQNPWCTKFDVEQWHISAKEEWCSAVRRLV